MKTKLIFIVLAACCMSVTAAVAQSNDPYEDDVYYSGRVDARRTEAPRQKPAETAPAHNDYTAPGVTDADLDAYNRRLAPDTAARAKNLRSPRKGKTTTSEPGVYTRRLSRFYDPDVSVRNADEVNLYLRNRYDCGAPYYNQGYYDDGSSYVDVYAYDPFAYGWSTSWYPWYAGRGYPWPAFYYGSPWGISVGWGGAWPAWAYRPVNPYYDPFAWGMWGGYGYGYGGYYAGYYDGYNAAYWGGGYPYYYNTNTGTAGARSSGSYGSGRSVYGNASSPGGTRSRSAYEQADSRSNRSTVDKSRIGGYTAPASRTDFERTAPRNNGTYNSPQRSGERPTYNSPQRREDQPVYRAPASDRPTYTAPRRSTEDSPSYSTPSRSSTPSSSSPSRSSGSSGSTSRSTYSSPRR